MRDKKQLIPIAGLLGTMAISTYMVTQLSGQGTARQGISRTRRWPRCETDRDKWSCAASSFWPKSEKTRCRAQGQAGADRIDADAAGEAEVELARHQSRRASRVLGKQSAGGRRVHVRD